MPALARLIAVALLLHVADALLTYFIISIGRGACIYKHEIADGVYYYSFSRNAPRRH